MADELKTAVDVFSNMNANMEDRSEAAWTLALAYVADLAERERRDAERVLPVTVEWLLEIGGLPDDSQAGDVSFRIYYLEPADRGTFLDGEFTHVVFCVDGSACVECYDEHGNSLEVVGIGFYRTRGQVLDLLKALGVKP